MFDSGAMSASKQTSSLEAEYMEDFFSFIENQNTTMCVGAQLRLVSLKQHNTSLKRREKRGSVKVVCFTEVDECSECSWTGKTSFQKVTRSMR